MNATMSDGVNVPFTIACVSDKNKKHAWIDNTLTIEMENIQLVQAPTETLKMRVYIARVSDTQYSRNQCKMKDDNGQSVDLKYHSYNIELKCLNYLHEFSKDYKYEIICKSRGSDKQEDEILFSCTVPRLAESVKSPKRFVSLMNRDLTNQTEHVALYFCIRRRFNGGNDKIDNARLNKAVSIFRNTGCDVVLVAKDGDVRAHKSILSQNSEVFRTMFSVEMKEKQSGTVDVSDIEKRVIIKMLDYLYTGKLGELGDMTEALFILAHRYQLHDLCRRCEEYYTFNVQVDNDNIVEILKLTDVYELGDLNECAVNFAKRHSQELTRLPRYREYLILSINLNNAVNMLILAVKYDLKDIKMECFDFIKKNYLDMMENEDFLNLFELNARLMKEIHVYVHKKKL